jgi:rhodanese-related sulfurtransferase
MDRCGGWRASLREAVDLVFVAAAFGILFNLYDSDGIELKAPSKATVAYQNAVPAPSADYAGFKPKSGPTPDKRAVSPSAVSFPRLSLEGAKIRYGKVLFVDARPANQYREGHIRGAIGFDVNDFERSAPEALPLLPFDREILAYCSGGDCDDSLMLARKLLDLGYKNVKLYEDGYQAWKKAGLPVSTGATP